MLQSRYTGARSPCHRPVAAVRSRAMRLQERYHIHIAGADFRVAKVSFQLNVGWVNPAVVADRRPERDESDVLLTFDSWVDRALLELVLDTGTFQRQPDLSFGDPIPDISV